MDLDNIIYADLILDPILETIKTKSGFKKLHEKTIVSASSLRARYILQLPFVYYSKAGVGTLPLGAVVGSVEPLSKIGVRHDVDLKDFGFEISARAPVYSVMRMLARDVIEKEYKKLEKDYELFTGLSQNSAAVVIFPKSDEALEALPSVLESITNRLREGFKNYDISLTYGTTFSGPSVPIPNYERLTKTIINRLLAEGLTKNISERYFSRLESISGNTGLSIISRRIMDEISGKSTNSPSIEIKDGSDRITIRLPPIRPAIARKLFLSIEEGVYGIGNSLKFDVRSSIYAVYFKEKIPKIKRDNPETYIDLETYLATLEDLIKDSKNYSVFERYLENKPDKLLEALNRLVSNHPFYTPDGMKVVRIISLEVDKNIPLRRTYPYFSAFYRFDYLYASEYKAVALLRTRGGGGIIRVIPLRSVIFKTRPKGLEKKLKAPDKRILLAKKFLHEIDNAIRGGIKKHDKEIIIAYGSHTAFHAPNLAYDIQYDKPIERAIKKALQMPSEAETELIKIPINATVKLVGSSIDNKVDPQNLATKARSQIQNVISKGGIFKKAPGDHYRLIVIPIVLDITHASDYKIREEDEVDRYLEFIKTSFKDTLEELSGVNRDVEILTEEIPYIPRATRKDYYADAAEGIKELVKLIEKLRTRLSENALTLFVVFEPYSDGGLYFDREIGKQKMYSLDYKYVIYFLFHRLYGKIPTVQFLRPKPSTLEIIDTSKKVYEISDKSNRKSRKASVHKELSVIAQLAYKAGAKILAPMDLPHYSIIFKAISLADYNVIDRGEEYLEKVLQAVRNDKYEELGELNLAVFLSYISARDLIVKEEEEEESEEEEREESEEDIIKTLRLDGIVVASVILPNLEVVSKAELITEDKRSSLDTMRTRGLRLASELIEEGIAKLEAMLGKKLDIKKRGRGKDKIHNVFVFITNPAFRSRRYLEEFANGFISGIRVYDSNSRSNGDNFGTAQLMRTITYMISSYSEGPRLIDFKSGGAVRELVSTRGSRPVEGSIIFLINPTTAVVENTIRDINIGLPKSYYVYLLPKYTYLKPGDIANKAIRTTLGAYLTILFGRQVLANFPTLKLPAHYYYVSEFRRTVTKIFPRRHSLLRFTKNNPEIAEAFGIDPSDVPNTFMESFRKFLIREAADIRRWV